MSFKPAHRLHVVSLASAVLAVSFVVACGPADGSIPAQMPDARGSNVLPGVRIHWTLGATLPSLPAQLSPTIILSKVILSVRSVQFVGDAGADARTRKQDFELFWSDGIVPPVQEFSNFPPGIYSAVSTKLDADIQEAYEFLGIVTLGGVAYPFDIYDVTGYSQRLPLSLRFAVGDGADIMLTADVANLIQSIDFTKLDNENGVLELGFSDEADKVNDAMKTLFSLTVQ